MTLNDLEIVCLREETYIEPLDSKIGRNIYNRLIDNIGSYDEIKFCVLIQAMIVM